MRLVDTAKAVVVDEAGVVLQAGAKAALAIDMTAANSDVTYTAKNNGSAGNRIVVTHVVPDAADAALAVTVRNGFDILVSLATDSSKAASTTGAQLVSGIAANAAAAALVVVTNTGESTGAGKVNASGPTKLTGGLDELRAEEGDEVLITEIVDDDDTLMATVVGLVRGDHDVIGANEVAVVDLATLVAACTEA